MVVLSHVPRHRLLPTFEPLSPSHSTSHELHTFQLCFLLGKEFSVPLALQCSGCWRGNTRLPVLLPSSRSSLGPSYSELLSIQISAFKNDIAIWLTARSLNCFCISPAVLKAAQLFLCQSYTCTGFSSQGPVLGRKNLPLWKETESLGFSGLGRWNTDSIRGYNHRGK